MKHAGYDEPDWEYEGPPSSFDKVSSKRRKFWRRHHNRRDRMKFKKRLLKVCWADI